MHARHLPSLIGIAVLGCLVAETAATARRAPCGLAAATGPRSACSRAAASTGASRAGAGDSQGATAGVYARSDPPAPLVYGIVGVMGGRAVGLLLTSCPSR